MILEKSKEISIIYDKSKEYGNILDRISLANPRLLEPYQMQMTSEIIETWKNELMNWASVQFSKDISLSPKQLFNKSALKWLSIFFGEYIDDDSLKDFKK